MSSSFWAVERRLLSEQWEAHAWQTVAYAESQEEVERGYALGLMHLNGHEMRLLNPGGAVVRHHADFRPAAAITWAQAAS